jgi:hypothetical protein
MKAAVFVALLGAMMAGNAKAQTIFADGFESGDARNWTSNLGNPSYPTGAICPPGATRCGAMTLAGGVAQQSPFWSKDFSYSGQVLYVSMMRMFPTAYSWSGESSENARFNWHHKMIIIDTADNIGRFHLNLSAGSTADLTSPFFRPEFESVQAPLINQWTDVRWPADGQWHQVEFEITRRPGAGNGRLRLWLDGALVFDKAGSTCGASCSPIVRAKVGAYVNQGADVTKTFYVGKTTFFGGTREQALAAQPPLPPAGPTVAERVKAALDAYAAAQDQLDIVGAQLIELQKQVKP